MRTGAGSLKGLRVLVVEDDFTIADLMAEMFEARGAEIVGPVATVKDALALIARDEPIDGAVLDVNLRGELVFPVADALCRRDVRFVFMTGYDEHFVEPRFAGAPCVQKPVALEQLAQALFG